MRNHSECEEAINTELAKGNEGKAMYFAARCDLHHGPQLAADLAAATQPVAATAETSDKAEEAVQ